MIWISQHFYRQMQRNAQTNLLLAASLALGTACTRPQAIVPTAHPGAARSTPKAPFTIQAGAFAQVENAERYAGMLRSQGLVANHFASKTGLFRVCIGAFQDLPSALHEARELQRKGLIAEFWVHSPGTSYSDNGPMHLSPLHPFDLRNKVVETALAQLGVPYLWGGSNSEGFDCSGLTTTVFQLNGLTLPRNSKAQFDQGLPLEQSELQPGDLVFFQTSSRSSITHVGIYIGENQFIHAPGHGKNVTRNSLLESYYQQRFRGGRSYILEPNRS